MKFTKGQTPFNKGKLAKEYLSDAALESISHTQFKNGRLPHNTLPEGAISIQVDKRRKPYKFYHTGKSNLPLHIHLWTLAHGSPPKGHCIIFKDGDTMNATLENLECISRSENMKRNSWHRWPKEIGKMVQLRGALKRQINKKIKSLHYEEQNK